jgi:hypothetical protein
MGGGRAARDLSVGRLANNDPLEALSSQELHDLAVRHARRRLDVGFFWRLMQMLPAAEAAAGRLDEAEADVQRLSAHVDDITDSGRGEVAELLRPFYLEYLTQHGVQPEQ